MVLFSKKNKAQRLSNYNFNDSNDECFVYIVECKDKTLYVGMTNNLMNRITDHKIGNGSTYVKKHGFNALVYFERCNNKKDAVVREREIKDKGTKYKWVLIRNFKRYISLLDEK